MDRRAALQMIVLAAGGSAAAHWLTPELEALGLEVHAGLTQTTPFRSFDAGTAALVSAASERIIPADDTPGALAAQVPRFIDKIMADWEDPQNRDRFLSGLASLDRDANSRHGRPFAECGPAEQDAMLTGIDDVVSAMPAGERAAHWFARLKSLTVYGYCTSDVGMRGELGAWPRPRGYDGNAPYTPRRRGSAGETPWRS